MPETEALLPRFRAAHTQVLGVSVDSVYSHANWGKSIGGVSFPLLSDFEPKGGLAKSLGLYLDGPGLTDRATVIIDSDGVIQYINAVGPGGRRDIGELAAECEKVDAANSGAKEAFSDAAGMGDAVLFVKSSCGASRAALLARENLHLTGVSVRNVSDDATAKADLEKAAGSDQAPCMVEGGKALQESDAIIARMVSAASVL